MFIAILLACTDPKTTGPETPADGPAEAALSMPAHGGCTSEYRTVRLMLEVTTTTVYDAEERVTSTILEAPGTGERRAEAWTFDEDGCKDSYRLDQMYGGDVYAIDWTATCDEHGGALHRDGTSYGSAFSTEYTNEYDEEDRLIRTDGAITTLDTGVTDHFTFEYAWDGEEEALYALTYNDVPQWREETDWEDRLALEFRYEDFADAARSYTLVYEPDAWGRVERTTRWIDGEAYSVVTEAWSDTIYHTLLTGLDSPIDDELDLQYVWACTDVFPWSCSADVDGSGGDGMDGTSDAYVTDEWSCG